MAGGGRLPGSKEICHLDKGHVACWYSWHRESLITLVVYAFLAVTAALERAAQSGRNDPVEADFVPPAATNSSACYGS